jgi:hypothetical protein
VDDRDLKDLGIKKGDVIRMKAGAQEWWNGPDAKKRSHADMEATSASASGSGGLPDDLATPVLRLQEELREVVREEGASKPVDERLVDDAGHVRRSNVVANAEVRRGQSRHVPSVGVEAVLQRWFVCEVSRADALARPAGRAHVGHQLQRADGK